MSEARDVTRVDTPELTPCPSCGALGWVLPCSECGFAGPPTPIIHRFINVYELWQNLGGQEEGGWWYDSGHLKFSIQVVGTLADIELVAKALVSEFPEKGSWFTRDDREIKVAYYETLYSGGAYQIQVSEWPGEDYPKERPHYE